jgi:DNA-binding transcriptional ArsR family regulator
MAKYADGLDAVSFALAHRGRRQAVARLARASASSSELADHLSVSLPTMQRHLEVLTRADLIRSTKRGRVVTHRLRPEPLQRYNAWLGARTTFWADQLDALEDHFKEKP